MRGTCSLKIPFSQRDSGTPAIYDLDAIDTEHIVAVTRIGISVRVK